MANPAITALTSLLGADSVFEINDRRAASYLSTFGSLIEKSPEYLGVALPDSVDSLRNALVALNAAQLGVLYTPNVYGNGASLIRGDRPVVILDTSRMDRILEINTQYAYALVEPGVSYRTLAAHLAKNAMSFWIDCPDDPEASVVGAVLGKQIAYTPYSDCALMQCGAECMLADGEMLRTGMGGIPGGHTWNLYKYAFGPYLDGLLLQSDFAVTTKLGLWIMNEPPAYKTFMVALPHAAAVSECVETLRPLLIAGTLPSTVVLLPEAEARQSDTTAWTVMAALYGSPPSIDLAWNAVRGAIGSITGARVIEGKEREDHPSWSRYHSALGGRLSPENLRDTEQSRMRALQITFAAPLEGSHALHLDQTCSTIASRHKLPYRRRAFLLGREMRFQIMLPDSSELLDASVSAAREIYSALSTAGFHLVEQSFPLRGLAGTTSQDAGFNSLLQSLQGALA